MNGCLLFLLLLLQVVIVTTWRSGSTFLEEVLNAHPGVFNVYEPLMAWGLTRLRGGGGDPQGGQDVLRNILHCK